MKNYQRQSDSDLNTTHLGIKTKNIFYLFMFFLTSNLAHAQISYSYVGFAEEPMVMKRLEKASNEKDNMTNGYVFNSAKKGDTLILTVNGPDRQIRKLTFKNKKKKCDFDQIIMPNCNSCSSNQVNTIIKDKNMKWKEIADNKYLSSYLWKTQLTITYDTNNNCTVMTFKSVNVGRDDYYKLYGDYAESPSATNTSKDDKLYSSINK